MSRANGIDDPYGGYDYVKLRAAITTALEPFINAHTMADGKEAVIEATAEAALMSLRFVCGSPSAERPRGLLHSKAT